MESKSESLGVSKINSGMLINLRLNDLWNKCHNAASKGDYVNWNEQLDRVWMELGGDVKEDDKMNGQYAVLCLKFAESFIPNSPEGFSTPSRELKNSLANQKLALMQKELFLRRLQNKQGKGTAYDDEDDFDIV